MTPGANLNPVRAHMQCAPTAENGSGYACRGGLYIRPERPPIPAAVRRRRPPVGAEPLTPGANQNPVRAHMQCAPTAENGSGYACRGGLYIRPERPPIPAASPSNTVGRHAHMPPWQGCDSRWPANSAAWFGGVWAPRPSVSKKSFRHAGRIFKLSKKFKNTCRLNAKGAFCPLHTSPAALSQTSSARFFDSLWRGVGTPPYETKSSLPGTHRCRPGAYIMRPYSGKRRCRQV